MLPERFKHPKFCYNAHSIGSGLKLLDYSWEFVQNLSLFVYPPSSEGVLKTFFFQLVVKHDSLKDSLHKKNVKKVDIMHI